jgi:hypothetical protein
MKKITAIFFFGSLFLIRKDIHSVRAQVENPCAPDPGIVTFEVDDYGFEITRAEKTFPKFPIVIGQDMEEQTGVDITVEIQSRPGEIDYQTFDGDTEECVGQTVW